MLIHEKAMENRLLAGSGVVATLLIVAGLVAIDGAI